MRRAGGCVDVTIHLYREEHRIHSLHQTIPLAIRERESNKALKERNKIRDSRKNKREEKKTYPVFGEVSFVSLVPKAPPLRNERILKVTGHTKNRGQELLDVGVSEEGGITD